MNKTDKKFVETPKIEPKYSKSKTLSNPQSSFNNSSIGSSSITNSTLIAPLTPHLLDCLRTVFAVIIWHENGAFATLTQAANCHKAQPKILAKISRLDNWQRALMNRDAGEIPAQLLHCLTLWQRILDVVLALKNGGLVDCFKDERVLLSTKVDDLVTKTTDALNQIDTTKKSDETGCELCEKVFAKPITTHMRKKHLGCGGPSYSHGYNINFCSQNS